MTARIMGYIEQHAGIVGWGGLGLGWITSFNAGLQALVLLCTLILTGPKAIEKLAELWGKYWPKVSVRIARLFPNG